MIVVKIEGKETIERALKTLKRKFDKTGTVKELRKRKTYQKPSEKRREEVRKAIRKDEWIKSHEND
jgi:small subunit ribosomal protein S21